MKDVRVFFACFFGALIGGIIAREIGSGFWWVGSIAGLIVGYLSYEFKVVLRGAQKAWKEVFEINFMEVAKSAAYGFLAVLLVIFATTIFAALIISFMYSWISLIAWITSDLEIYNCAISSVISTICGYLLYKLTDNDNKEYFYVGLMNPFFVILYLLPKNFFLLVKKLPTILRGTKKFFALTLRYIHSDVRLLCGVDAAIGAGVGFFAGDILIGALFGGVFGLLNYKVVRTYLLKPATVETK